MPSLSTVVSTIAVVVLAAASANHLNWRPRRSTKSDLQLQILKTLRIEQIKLQILQDLGFEKPPTFQHPLSPIPEEILQMIVESGEPEAPVQEVQANLADLMIFPTNRDFQCERCNDSSCRRYQFKIPPDVVPSSTEFCIRKLESQSSENITISVLCSPPRQQGQEVFERREISGESNKTKWLFLPISTLKDWKFWQGNVECSFEITGIRIDEKEGNLPLLKMREDLEPKIRERRTENSTLNTTCMPVPFNVSFEEMGFGDWIVYPKSYIANVCKGYCLHSQNYIETFMDILIQRNRTLEAEFGQCWKTCCRPKEYGTLRMLYREPDDTIVYRNLTKMNILACSCS